MDTLIVVCLVLSSALAAPQQYVHQMPPGSHQLHNPRVFNPLPGQINNEFSPNQKLGQAPSLATVSVQQGLLSIHNNQEQSSFGLQASQNNQGPSPISLQEIINNVDSLNGNGQQTAISNIGFNNDLNNPIRVASSIGHFNQGTDNPGLPTTPHGSSNGINGNNVDPNGSVNELLANNLAGAQYFSRGDSTHVNANVVFDVNTQGLSSNINSANTNHNNVISGQSEISQNNEQLFPHQNSHPNQNLNSNAHVGTLENLELNNEFILNQSVQNTGDNQRTLTDNAIMIQQRNEVNSRCGRGMVPNARGACVQPEVSRNIFVYAAPKMSHDSSNTSSEVPRPKIEYNLVFVRTPKGNGNGEPIIIPPPQQKTLVYVLSKKKFNGVQEIIEVPAGPKHNPEVYYVNYEEGDNPLLPGGIELETALSAAAQTGQTVNDILNDPLLREEMSHDNIASTDNTGSMIKDTMFNGVDLHETDVGNLAITLINNPNNEETYNNDGNANNQLDQTTIVDVPSITGISSDIGSINNGFGLNTAGGISLHNVGSFDGPHPTGDLGVPPGNGINTGSASFVTNGEQSNFRQTLPTPSRSYNTY